MNLLIANAASETGALLEDYLIERGVKVDGTGPVVCYGSPAPDRKVLVLNRACKTNKMERLRLMTKAGVPTVKWFDKDSIPPAKDIKFPLFARQAMGHGAKDLATVFQFEEIAWRIKAGWDWFSEIVPIARELRIWVWMDPLNPGYSEILGAFEKTMDRPQDYKKMGRNFGQGFEFKPTVLEGEDYPLIKAAVGATTAIGLDFAAIDLIEGKDGKVYVLEANTAPGVIRSGAQATLAKLADKIVEWHKAVI